MIPQFGAVITGSRHLQQVPLKPEQIIPGVPDLLNPPSDPPVLPEPPRVVKKDDTSPDHAGLHDVLVHTLLPPQLPSEFHHLEHMISRLNEQLTQGSAMLERLDKLVARLEALHNATAAEPLPVTTTNELERLNNVWSQAAERRQPGTT